MTLPAKSCPECGETKPLVAFHKDARKSLGVRSRCRDCANAHAREYARTRYATNKTAVLDANRRYYERNRSKVDAIRKAWAGRHPEIAKARGARWVKANPEKHREKCARRRARLVAATVDRVDYQRIRERDEMLCHLCGDPVEPADLHFDHVVPLSRGGAHSEDNIAVAHGFCNLSKGTRLVEELAWR